MKKSAILLLSLVLIITCQLLLAYGQGAVGIGLFVTGNLDSDGDGLADNADTDDDNDGILDENDFLTGNLTYPTAAEAINFTINQSANFTQVFNGTYLLNISNTTQTLIEFNWTFNSTNVINLRNITINRTTIGYGAIEISGLNLRNIAVKTAYVERLNSTAKAICIKDAENATISMISSACSSSDEKLIVCDGTSQYGYVCDNLGSRYKITGLNHSSLKELCIDTDGDGYGTGCAAGNDCDDNDASKNTDCSTPAPSGGGGGGGGGSGGGGGGGPPAIQIITDFSVDKTTLKVVLKQGQTKTETLSIKNTGTTIFDIKAYLAGIEKFKVSPEISEITSTLSPDEERTIELVFRALENEKPDIYPGKITLKSPSVEKEIATVVEVDSAEPLFDVDAEVLADSKKIFAGEEILLEVNLFNVRGFGRVDVGVEYSIKDLKGNLVATEHETLAVETQAKFTRALLVPSDLRPGTYVAFVKVTYADSVGTSSDLFEVKTKTIRLYPIQIKDYKLFLFGAAIILIVGILVFSAYRLGYLKRKMPKAKVEEIKELKDEEKIQKLGKELEALKAAYESKFISEESYQRDKKRIEERLSRLK